MERTQWLVGILILAGVALSALAMDTSGQQVPEEGDARTGIPQASDLRLRIGTCPTLFEDAQRLANKREGTDLTVYGSTAQALEALKAREIDVAIVGRIAHPVEISADTGRLLLEEGHTLVTRRKSSIEYAELCSIHVCTHLAPEVAEALLPPCAMISYHQELEGALGCLDSAVLVGWEEYPQGVELLVVTDGEGKAKRFRAVAAYFSPEAEEPFSGMLGDIYASGPSPAADGEER